MYLVSFNYKVDGSWFGDTINTDMSYRKGDTMVVEYDPQNPERNRFSVSAARQKWIVGCVVAGIFLFVVVLRSLGK